MESKVKSKLSILIHLAYADTEFTEIEKETIRKIGKENGVEDLEIDLLCKDPLPLETNSLSLHDKVDIMLYMLRVLLSDKEIHENEENFAKNIADKLGFKTSVITFLIEYSTMDASVLKEMVLPYLKGH